MKRGTVVATLQLVSQRQTLYSKHFKTGAKQFWNGMICILLSHVGSFELILYHNGLAWFIVVWSRMCFGCYLLQTKTMFQTHWIYWCCDIVFQKNNTHTHLSGSALPFGALLVHTFGVSHHFAQERPLHRKRTHAGQRLPWWFLLKGQNLDHFGWAWDRTRTRNLTLLHRIPIYDIWWYL